MSNAFFARSQACFDHVPINSKLIRTYGIASHHRPVLFSVFRHPRESQEVSVYPCAFPRYRRTSPKRQHLPSLPYKTVATLYDSIIQSYALAVSTSCFAFVSLRTSLFVPYYYVHYDHNDINHDCYIRYITFATTVATTTDFAHFAIP